MNLREKVVQALRKVRYFRRVKKIAVRRKSAWLRRVREATADIEFHKGWLHRNPAAHPARREHHERKLRAAHRRRRRCHNKLAFWRKRYVWARNRDEFWEELLASRRRKLASQKITAADFKKEMTRGHEWWTLTDANKALIAIGTLKFGLWVTSTYRPETPGSHHAEDPTRVNDMAGEWDDMIAYQHWIFDNYRQFILELFGPDNALAVKNGQSIGPLPEGSFLEDLHDSHDHSGFMDADFAVSYPA